MKINIGDIYRDQASKYNFVKKFTSEIILDLTYGKYFDFAKSELLLSNGAKEIWSLDLLNDQMSLTLRKHDKQKKVCFEKKCIDDLENIKFDLIISFNVMRKTNDIDQILKIVKNHLPSNGIFVISILNNNSDKISSEQNFFLIDNFKNILNTTFSNTSFFSQGDLIQMKTYSQTVSPKNNSLITTKSLMKQNLKKLFKLNKTSQIFYLKYILSPYQSYKKFRRERKFKIDPKKYEIIPFDDNLKPISIIAVCQNLIS